MTGRALISFDWWRMPRAAFLGYSGVLGLVLAYLLLVPDRPEGLGQVWAYVWLAAILLLLVLPIAQSMRLKAVGRSPLWPLLPFAGLLALAWQGLAELVSISGAPSGDTTPAQDAVYLVGKTSLGLAGLITLICLLPDRWIAPAARKVRP